MVLTRTEIQKRSDEKRGVKLKGFKLHLDTIALIERLAVEMKISQTSVITQAVKLLEQAQNKA